MTLTRGLTFDEYAAIDAVNFSTLKDADKSMAHYRYRCDHPRTDTPRFAFGRAVHTAVLEPDRFALEYAVWDGGRRGTNAYKEFEAVNEGRTVLSADDYDACLAVRDAVRAHPAASDLLRGDSEVTVTWTDPDTGLECKARVDHINEDCIVDLKTAASTDPREFGNTVGKYLYHGQLAHYSNGVRLPGNPHIIAVEIEPPYDVVVYRLPDEALHAGQQLVADLLAHVAACNDTGVWPGRFSAVQDLALPNWLLAGDDTEEFGGLFGGSVHA